MNLDTVAVETDVLVIGGGLAGCMAAIRAAGEGDLRVTLVDKSDTRASGAAANGIDHIWAYIPPVHEKMGYTLEDMAEDHRVGPACRFLRRDLFELTASTMYDRVLDLERFGVRFRYDDGPAPGGFRIVEQFHSVPTSFNFDGGPLKQKLTAEARRRGVRILNRVQMTDLLVSEGQVAGAVGVGTRTGGLYVFRAKAAVLATGRTNRLSRNPSGIDFNTRLPGPLSGDGNSMALRAGLSLVNGEFLTGRLLTPCGYYNPNYGDPRNTVQPAARIVDGEGSVVVDRTRFYDWGSLGKERVDPAERRARWLEERRSWRGGRGSLPKRIARGEGPFYLDLSQATDSEKEYIAWSIAHEGKGTQFLRYFEGEEGLDLRENPQEYAGWANRELSGTTSKGLWLTSGLETDVRNLFGAGDEVGGMPWGSSPMAFALGWRAGETAAERARREGVFLPAEGETLRQRAGLCGELLGRKRGFHWREVQLYVQNLMDFYCGDVRGEGLLARGLERLETAREAPLRAENPHELARALEVMSIVDNAELTLRACLERKESRAAFDYYRGDYPEQDDEQWLAFLVARREGGKFSFRKVPVAP